MEDRKFVCKYCLKRFPCGKSLGGHIRTHMSEERNNAAASASASAAAYTDIFKFDCVKKKRDLASEEAVGGNGNPIYGLRENPKKTTRFVHSATTLENEMIKFCKECGKGFPSLKALCGHMASHSEKDKKIDKEKLVIDSDESDDGDDDEDDTDDDDDDTCDTTTTMNLRKSKRMRFKSLTFSNLQSSSVNGSSSVSEVEQEQEEVAMCLMLLSKDFSQKGRFGSESSDNNSVVLETKSKASSHDAAKIVIRKNGSNKLVSNHDVHEFVENKKKVVKDMKLKSVVGIGVSNDSDSRNFRYGSKIKFLESSNASNCEFKRPKVEEEKSGFDDFRRSKCNVTMFKKSGVKDLDHNVKKNESTARKIDSRKKDNYEEGFGFKNNEKTNENGRKSWKYECFDSEKKDNDCYDYSTSEESDENSSESDSFTAAKSHHNNKAVKRKKSSKGKKKLKSKKSKEYECPICYKIFRSGQALGGHKRSHFVGGSEENTLVIKQGAPCLIDLNLPAPIDE